MLQENNRTEFKSELNDKLEKEVVTFLNGKFLLIHDFEVFYAKCKQYI